MTNIQKAHDACPAHAMLPGALERLLVDMLNRQDASDKRLDAIEGNGALTQEQGERLQAATDKVVEGGRELVEEGGRIEAEGG